MRFPGPELRLYMSWAYKQSGLYEESSGRRWTQHALHGCRAILRTRDNTVLSLLVNVFIIPKEVKVHNMGWLGLFELNGNYTYGTSIRGLEIFVKNGSGDTLGERDPVAHELLNCVSSVDVANLFKRLPIEPFEALREDRSSRNTLAEAQEWIDNQVADKTSCRVITVSRNEMLMYPSGHIGSAMPAIRVSLFDTPKVFAGVDVRRSDRSLIVGVRMKFRIGGQHIVVMHPEFSGVIPALPENAPKELNIYEY